MSAALAIGDQVPFEEPERHVGAPRRSPDDPHWILCRSDVRLGDQTRFALDRAGFDSFRPLERNIRLKGKNRIPSEVTKPVFGEYLFVNAAPGDVWLLEAVPMLSGVGRALRDVVRIGGAPLRIPTREFLKIRPVVEAPDFRKSALDEGDPVRVLIGAFVDESTSIEKALGDGRYRVLLPLFGHMFPKDYERAELEYLGE